MTAPARALPLVAGLSCLAVTAFSLTHLELEKGNRDASMHFAHRHHHRGMTPHDIDHSFQAAVKAINGGKMDQFDPARADNWALVAPLPEAKSLLAAATGGDGRIYAIGGTSDDGPPVNPRVYAYDPNLDSWTQVASLSSSRRNMAAATDLNGIIYVFGGYDFSGPPFALGIVERYDPIVGFWQRMTDMPTLRQSPAAATGADGRIYVMGGTDTGFQTTAVTEVYDPVTDSWSTASPMNSPRTGFGAATGVDGRIYVFGGYTGSAYVNTAEAYDPSTDTWTPVASMNQGRYSLAGVTGANGLIYAIGGYYGSDLTSVEAYDLNSDTWTLVASMNIARSGHAAALGPDGRIFAIAGPATSVEAYTADVTPSQAPRTQTLRRQL